MKDLTLAILFILLSILWSETGIIGSLARFYSLVSRRGVSIVGGDSKFRVVGFVMG